MSAAETNGRSRQVGDEDDEDASEAQAQVIASLRAQVTDLFSQVTQLNSKLVSSYDRMSDLEDQLHDASNSLRNASLTVSSLELERSHHLAALNTGLLVEKAHVTAELNRLMERATEEAAQRGQAETARHDIEKDLDDLSASLFDQANTMVAEARLNRAKSERKVQDAEQALKITEDAVKDMQAQMQVLQAEKEAAERDAQEAKLSVRKGKWVECYDPHVGEVPRIRFMTAHTPYAEFTMFVAHLRGLRVSQPTPPAMSTLLTQPFTARILAEDSEPTVRLDLAPSLNWLSRRSVLTAIHSGMLTVEPLPFSSLVQELHQHPQSPSNSSLSCALCGTFIARLPSASPVSRTHHTNGSSWFKYPLALGSTQNHNAYTPQSAQCEPPGQVYVFRVAVSATSAPPPALIPVHTSSVSMSGASTSSRPSLNPISSSRVLQAQSHNSPYPLCMSNYCMTRLRSTCSLWAFVRVGIVERIWEGGIVQIPKPLVNGNIRETSSLNIAGAGSQPTSGVNLPSISEKPPVPPRRRRLWEMASALGERAVGWGKEGGETAKEKEKEIEKGSERELPTPPPSHPSVPHPYAKPPTSRVGVHALPPPPKRDTIPSMATIDSATPSSGTQDGTAATETGDPAADADSHVDSDKADCNASGFSTPPDEITFAAPLSEPSPPPSTTTHPVAAEPNAPTITKDQLPPLSPHAVPLPMTPTTANPLSRVTSPTPRPRSQPSSPTSLPPSSRSTSPAISRSPTGSPVPTGIGRAASPSPGHPPLISHIRGKTSMLASSKLASPVPGAGSNGAPPLPRRAAARRPVPRPPMSGNPKVVGEAGKEDEGLSATAGDPTSKVDAHKAGKLEVPTETENHDGEGGGDIVKEAITPQATFAPTDTAEAAPGPVKDVGVDDVRTSHGNMEVANGTSATVHPDPLPPPAAEGDSHMSMDTTSTKQSSHSDGEGFASDATWEERTWKELMRLKEDMFWARTGGIRAIQG